MDFDFQWLLLALPISFALGWVASRFDWRQMRRDEHRSPKAYFKGLTHLLNEQPDEAIDAFIEVVQNDPDTSELHFALGNLFRKRGEFERAVRVHQHLLARSDLKAEDRERAQYALAQDYMRAGLFDRAENAFSQLLQGQHETEARLSLLQLHERARNWPAAIQMAHALNELKPGTQDTRIAHHWCELADEHATRSDVEQARECQKQAQAVAPSNLRAQMQIGRLLSQAGDQQAAYAQWQTVIQNHPEAVGLAAPALAQAAQATGHQTQAHALLNDAYERTPDLDILDAWSLLVDNPGEVLARYTQHVEARPNVAAAAALASKAPKGTHPEAFLEALQRTAEQSHRYRCTACGFEAQRHFWRCPGCLAWDSFPLARDGS